MAEGYGGQFLMLEAKPAAPELGYVAPGTEDVLAAARSLRRCRRGPSSTDGASGSRAFDGKAVIWGAGSKGITFANALEEAGRPLAALVDLNPRKHGLIAPGVALPVVGPDDLAAIRPDLVLISNALYEAEITSQVRGMGLGADFDVIAG